LIGQSIPKLDAQALVTGRPVYTDDLAAYHHALIVKILRSPHAHARIRSIDRSRAEKVPGVVCILTHEDVPHRRYTNSGESYPEPCPHDRFLLEPVVRYVGDEVAIVAAESEKAAARALELIRVDYEILPAVLDFTNAENNPVLVHAPNEGVFMPDDVGLDCAHNVVSRHKVQKGDLSSALSSSDRVVTGEFFTPPQSHCMMETHRSFCFPDEFGRLTFWTSTQSPFHTRRQTAAALGLPYNRIRVMKPRVGGAFGGKNITVCEPYVGIVTLKTGRPAKMVLTRKETFTATASRHEMRFRITLGASADGTLKAVQFDCLNNTGAYGEDGPAVTMVSAGNMLPMHNRTDAIEFTGTTVYTNLLPGGAMRGYGAAQSTFAIECMMDELADACGIDPIAFRLKNCAKEGDTGGILTTPIRSSSLLRCIARGREMIGWNEKYPVQQLSETRLRAVGMAAATHGSGVQNIGQASVSIRLEEDGTYLMRSGATDLGTGSDTILTQIAAQALNCPVSRINTRTADTDGPYDTGAFASCTTYVTGNAVIKAAESFKNRLFAWAGKRMACPPDTLVLLEDRVAMQNDPSRFMELSGIGMATMIGDNAMLEATETYLCTDAPNPFAAGFAEIDLDLETGKIDLHQFVLVVDCGKVINPALARIQAEGGIVQSIGYALYEQPVRDQKGRLITDSFMQYKIPTRLDVRNIRVAFEESSEPTGPFGAKSLGELVIHTPAPAIANALFHATGIKLHELPMTPEKVYRALCARGLNK